MIIVKDYCKTRISFLLPHSIPKVLIQLLLELIEQHQRLVFVRTVIVIVERPVMIAPYLLKRQPTPPLI